MAPDLIGPTIMDPRGQYLGDYCRGSKVHLQIDHASEGCALGNESGKVEGPSYLRSCCLSFVCFPLLRCSVLVDSHACDEIPWQEPLETTAEALPACLDFAGQQTTTTVEQATTT